MPVKGKKKKASANVEDVTFTDAFSAFHTIADTMRGHQKTEGNRISAFLLPVTLLRAAAMTKDANGEAHELAVRGVTASNVEAMRDSIGHSGALSSANFLVCEQLEEVSEEGSAAELTSHPTLTFACAEYERVRAATGQEYVSKAGGACYVTYYIVR